MKKTDIKKQKTFDFVAFAAAIATAREKKNLSYIKAGELVGTSGPNIERIEKLTQEPRVSLCVSICDKLLSKPLSSFIS